MISREEGRFAFSREGGRLGDVGRSIMSSWLIGSWLAVIWFVNPFVIVRLDISGLMAAEGLNAQRTLTAPPHPLRRTDRLLEGLEARSSPRTLVRGRGHWRCRHRQVALLL